MTPQEKYNKFVSEKFLNELEGYSIYYLDSTDSFYWINPETNEWRFELEKSGTLWWNYSWGRKFKNYNALTDHEFEILVKSFITHTLKLKVEKMNSNLLNLGDDEEREVTFEIPIYQSLTEGRIITPQSIEIKNFYSIDEETPSMTSFL